MENKSWIDIKKQKPPIDGKTEDTYFWTLDDGGEESIFWWDQLYGGWHDSYGNPVDWTYHITHWQPIQRPSNTKKYSKEEVISIIEWMQQNYNRVEDEMAAPYEDNDIEGLPDDFFEQAYKEALNRAFENYGK